MPDSRPDSRPDAGSASPLHAEQWTEAAGRPLRTLAAGHARPGLPPVLLIPGLGSVGYMVELLHAVGGWTDARLLDLPGFGRRETADLPADLDSLTATLVAALPATPAVLVGHSTGSQLATRAAVEAPDRVAGVVLVGPMFEPAARRPRNLLGRHLRTSLFEPPGQMRYTLPDYTRGGRRFAQYLRSALADRPEERISSVTVPLFASRGRHDHYASQEWVQWLADAAPRGRARTLPGAHNVPYLHPGAVALLAGEACAAAA